MPMCAPSNCKPGECPGLVSCSDCKSDCVSHVHRLGVAGPCDSVLSRYILLGRPAAIAPESRLVQSRRFYCSSTISYCGVIVLHFFLSQCSIGSPPAVAHFGESFSPGWIWARYRSGSLGLISVGSVYKGIYYSNLSSYDSLEYYTTVGSASSSVTGPRGGTYVTQCDKLRIWSDINCSYVNINPTGGVVSDNPVLSYFNSKTGGDNYPVYFTNQHQVTSFSRIRSVLSFDVWVELSRTLQGGLTTKSLGRFYLAEPNLRRECMRVCESSEQCDLPARCQPQHIFSYENEPGIFDSAVTHTLAYSFVGSAGPIVLDLFSVSIDGPFWITSQDGVRVMFATPWCTLSVVNPYCIESIGSLVHPSDYVYVRAPNGSVAAIPEFCMFHFIPVSTSRESLPIFVDSIEQSADQLCVKVVGYGSFQDAFSRCGSDLQYYPTIADVFASLNMPVTVVGNVSEYIPLFGDLDYPYSVNFSSYRAQVLSRTDSYPRCLYVSDSSFDRYSGVYRRACDYNTTVQSFCVPHVEIRRNAFSGYVDDVLSSLRHYFSEFLSGVFDFFGEGLRSLFAYSVGSIGFLFSWFPFHALVSFFIVFGVLLLRHYDLLPSLVLSSAFVLLSIASSHYLHQS